MTKEERTLAALEYIIKGDPSENYLNYPDPVSYTIRGIVNDKYYSVITNIIEPMNNPFSKLKQCGREGVSIPKGVDLEKYRKNLLDKIAIGMHRRNDGIYWFEDTCQGAYQVFASLFGKEVSDEACSDAWNRFLPKFEVYCLVDPDEFGIWPYTPQGSYKKSWNYARSKINRSIEFQKLIDRREIPEKVTQKIQSLESDLITKGLKKANTPSIIHYTHTAFGEPVNPKPWEYFPPVVKWIEEAKWIEDTTGIYTPQRAIEEVQKTLDSGFRQQFKYHNVRKALKELGRS